MQTLSQQVREAVQTFPTGRVTLLRIRNAIGRMDPEHEKPDTIDVWRNLRHDGWQVFEKFINGKSHGYIIKP